MVSSVRGRINRYQCASVQLASWWGGPCDVNEKLTFNLFMVITVRRMFCVVLAALLRTQLHKDEDYNDDELFSVCDGV